MNIRTPVQRVQITRADYECRFGLRPDEFSIGAILCNDNDIPLAHYVFLTTQQEIAALERLYSLGE